MVLLFIFSDVALSEFTSILLDGPPQMVIVGLPFELSAPESVGWVTRMGTGATTSTIAAIPIALTVEVAGPSNRISPVFNVLWTVALITVTGSTVDRVTPGTAPEPGKSKVTVSAAVPPNPLAAAYLQGVFASVVVQVNAPPVANAAAPVALDPLKMLIMPAWAAASAAACAIWR